jgi:WD40 repeat protein
MIMQYRLVTILFALATLVSGCQIADQAIDLISTQSDSNILKEIDIPLLSAPLSTAGAPLKSHQGEVVAVRTVPGQKNRFLTLGKDKALIEWNIPSGQGALVREIGETPTVATIGTQRALVAWSNESGVFIECISGCSKKFALKRFKSRPSSLAFHTNDTALLIGGLDGRIYRWRFMEEQTTTTMEEREKMVERYIAHHAVVSAVAPHPAGRAFFSGDWSGSLIAWVAYSADAFGGEFDKNVFKGRFYTDIPNAMIASRLPDRGISSISVSRNGERIALGLEDGNVEVWETRGFTLAARKLLHNGRVMSVDISEDGSRVVSVGKDTKVRVTELADDPMHLINPYAYRQLLLEVSENPIPLADSVTFIAPNQIIATTRNGALAEVVVKGTPAPVPTPKPRKPVPQDSDY